MIQVMRQMPNRNLMNLSLAKIRKKPPLLQLSLAPKRKKPLKSKRRVTINDSSDEADAKPQSDEPESSEDKKKAAVARAIAKAKAKKLQQEGNDKS